MRTLFVTGTFDQGVREAHAVFLETQEPLTVRITPRDTKEDYDLSFGALQHLWKLMGLKTAHCSTGTCG